MPVTDKHGFVDHTAATDETDESVESGFRVAYPLSNDKGESIKGADGRMSVRVGFRTVELVQVLTLRQCCTLDFFFACV